MNRKEIIAGLIIALAVAFFLSPLASSSPDGMEKVAQDFGFMEKGKQATVFKSPVPDYIFPGLKSEKLATVISCAIGTLVIFGIVYCLACLLKRQKDCK